MYPSATQTLAGQLTAKHLTWKAYLEGMDEGAGGVAATGAGGVDGACEHPALGPPTRSRRSLPPRAGLRDVPQPVRLLPLGDRLPRVREQRRRVERPRGRSGEREAYAELLLHRPGPLRRRRRDAVRAGAAAGWCAADGFLQKVVPEILASKAYKENGLLVITVDEAPSSGEYADSSSCCGQPNFPNVPAPAGALGKPGGGQVGALLLSPFVKGGNLEQGTTTTSRCCARSRTCSACHISATRKRCGAAAGLLVRLVLFPSWTSTTTVWVRAIKRRVPCSNVTGSSSTPAILCRPSDTCCLE